MKFNKKYVAKTLFGLEEILLKELTDLGTKNTTIANRAVYFEGNEKLLYLANLSLRTCLRILQPLTQFKANNPDQLYTKSKEYNWSELISTNETFSIDSVVHSKNFRHSKYASLKVKDAIVDQIRKEKGERPNIEIENPTYRINVHIEEDNCTISLDSSGESLHKRGYRLSGERAPLNEVLAAGMILLSEWDQQSNFLDPMCGSGTIIIEAALMALNFPPNLYREQFGFMNWKSFDRNIFASVKSELISKKRNCNFTILGNDINNNSIMSAKANAKSAKVDSYLKFTNEDFFKLKNNLDSGTIISNPPYGERLRQDSINDFYKNIGDTLKNNYNGFDSWILSSNKEALKKLGLRTSRRLLLYNGSLECKFHNYKMYKGSLKRKYD